AWEFVQLVRAEAPGDRMEAATVAAPEEIWHEIVAEYPELRWSVAQNKNVPESVLRILAKDADPQVRSMVARKRKLPQDLLQQLAHDADSGVRLAVVHHPSADASLLRMLTRDEWSEVAQKATKRLQE